MANSIITPQTINSGAFGVILSAAMTAAKGFDGTEAVGTSMALVFTAGASGGRCDTITISYSGTAGAAPSSTSSATVVRIWKNNASVNTTAANNTLLANVAIPAQLYSNTAALPTFTVYLGESLEAGERIYVGNTTAVGGTNCALAVSATGVDY